MQNLILVLNALNKWKKLNWNPKLSKNTYLILPILIKKYIKIKCIFFKTNIAYEINAKCIKILALFLLLKRTIRLIIKYIQ